MCVDVRNGLLPFEGIAQAPKEYWEHFEQAERLENRNPIRTPNSAPTRLKVDDMRVFA